MRFFCSGWPEDLRKIKVSGTLIFLSTHLCSREPLHPMLILLIWEWKEADYHSKELCPSNFVWFFLGKPFCCGECWVYMRVEQTVKWTSIYPCQRVLLQGRFMASGVSSVPSPVSSSHVYIFSILNVYLYLPSHLLVGIWMVSEFLFNHYKQCYNKYLSFLAFLSEFLEDKLSEGRFSQTVCMFLFL